MGLMVEREPLELDSAGQEPCLVAARAETTRIGDLGHWTWPGAGGHILGQLDQAEQLAADFFANAGREMALDARDVAVARLLPGM